MKEQTYFKLTFAIAVLLVISTIVSFVILVSAFSKGTESAGNNVFELMYMAFHFLVVGLACVFSLRAIKDDKSIILNTLMYNQFHRRSRPAMIIATILSAIGLGFFIYALLVITNVGVPHFNFPLGLNLDILNTALTLFSMGLIFFFYPFIKGETNK